MIMEIDGPPTAWFEDSDGDRQQYVVRALASPNAGDLIQAYAAWKANIDAVFSRTRILVWRQRPQLTFDKDDIIDVDGQLTANPNPQPHWRIYFRYALLPLKPTDREIPIKPEGAPIARI
jgi:hypothetical protein